MRIQYWLVFVLWLMAWNLSAQNLSNWRMSWHDLDSMGNLVLPDSLCPIAMRLSLWHKGEALPDSLWRIDTTTLCAPLLASEKIELRYRAVPLSLSDYRQNKPLSLIGNTDSMKGVAQILGDNYAYNPYKTVRGATAEVIDMQGIKYSGTFGRAISVGSNQSLIQDANFNLQLSGKLGDVEVLAAITDNNVPMQPSGNTQQLQDFDRVFIEFKLGRQSLIAGDYTLSHSAGSYFARYNRRLQGGRLSNSFKISKNQRLNTSVSVALARGKFARNIIQGIEGNQGPYKLTGNNGERFIIAIAGTEQVFIDGQPLTRGADKDYVIDYNLGEVRFTNRQLITKDKRIIIEFTYNDLNFVRSLYDLQAEWKQDKISFRLSHFSEQDAKNQSTQQPLNDTTRAVLRAAGDDPNAAYTSGIGFADSTNLLASQHRYKLIDTIINGINYDSVLVYAPSDSSGVYLVQFSLVSAGGNYIRLINGSNGAVYQWIAPDALTGKSLGTHAPVVLLIAPKKQQLSSFGVKIPTGKKGFFDAELGVSNNDINTFSSIGNDDNIGLATRLYYEQNWDIKKDSQLHKIGVQAHYEYVQARFLPLDPYRAREFQRDWNTIGMAVSNEHWAGLSVGLQNRYIKTLRYEFSTLYKDSLYNGFRQDLRLEAVPSKQLRIQASGNFLSNQTTTDKGQFLRPQAEISYSLPKLGGLQLGTRFEQERNELRDLSTDSLNRASFYFDIFSLYAILPPANRKWELQAKALHRIDYAPDSLKFIKATTANEGSVSAKWQQKNVQSLDFNLNYRSLSVEDTDTSRTKQIPKNTYLGRSEYNLNIKKGFLRANTIYELGAGQQQKIEYNYIQTDLGAGTHIWIDRNGDSQQQQNEFEQANFQDQANYIRITILSNEFIATQNVAFSQSLDCNPKVLFARQPQKLDSLPIAKFFLRFSARSLLRIDRKSFAQNFAQNSLTPFNPFLLSVADSSLVGLTSLVQNSLYFNRAMPNFNFEISQSDSRNKNLLATGFESRQKNEYSSLLRLKLHQKLLFSQSNSLGIKANSSEFFADRDYKIRFFSGEVQLSYLHAQHFRLVGKYNYRRQDNQIGLNEQNRSHGLSLEATYSKSRSWNVRAQLNFTRLRYTGSSNTPVEFAMNEGLRIGSNLLWSCTVDKTIAQNVQFSLSYEGRKMADSPIIHVGRAQIRANF
jgi:hypothetical protein